MLATEWQKSVSYLPLAIGQKSDRYKTVKEEITAIHFYDYNGV
jgi:hypothetical protein|tara:strand:+ start:311 stop:439 length:129 start_codon:yes stop_codon:yes gene_type:complete